MRDKIQLKSVKWRDKAGKDEKEQYHHEDRSEPGWPNTATAIYFLLGWPVKHSLSPVMQNAAFRARELNSVYLALPVPPEELAAVVRLIRWGDIAGANVTVPHKEAVLPLLDELSPAAEQIGAVNVIINREGRLIGENSDAAGLLAALQEELGFDPAGRRVLVLGAGGAARAAAFALAGKGARLFLANRTRARAEQLALEAAVRWGASVDVLSWDSLSQWEDPVDLIINCTSAGLEGKEPEEVFPLPWHRLEPPTMIYDLIYHPGQTPLERAASRRGMTAAGGLSMLLHQGAIAFRLWTGLEPPLAVMRRALQAATERRE